MIVRSLALTDRAEWEPMWFAYRAFYETTVPQATTAAAFARLCDPDVAMHGTLVLDATTGHIRNRFRRAVSARGNQRALGTLP